MDKCLLAGSDFLVTHILGDSVAFGNICRKKAGQEPDMGSLFFGVLSKQY